MYSVLNIGCGHATSSGGWVNAIGLKERRWIPKEIKIVHEVKTQAGLSQVFNRSSLEKRASPRPSVGMGPEIKMDFPQVRRKSKRELKALLVSSVAPQARSLDPTCTTMRVMDEESDCSSPGSFPKIEVVGQEVKGRGQVEVSHGAVSWRASLSEIICRDCSWAMSRREVSRACLFCNSWESRRMSSLRSVICLP